MSSSDGLPESQPVDTPAEVDVEVEGSTSTENSMTKPWLKPMSSVPRYCICIFVLLLAGVVGAVIGVVFTVGRGKGSSASAEAGNGDGNPAADAGGSGGEVSGKSAFGPVTFKDMSIEAGLSRKHGPKKKYGGAFVGDLDGDGKLDVIFTHHDQLNVQLFYGNGDGTFKEWTQWRLWTDTHAVVGVRLQPWDKRMHYLVTIGMCAFVANARGTKAAPTLALTLVHPH